MYSHISVIDVVDNRFIKTYFGKESCHIVLFSYLIAESTMEFSDKLIDEMKNVEELFYGMIQRFQISGLHGWSIDCSGCIQKHPVNSHDYIGESLPMHELLQSLPETRGIFKTLELGCCATYSHHIYGTKCLCCVLVTDSLESISGLLGNYSIA
jgi:hypothetical protein